MTIKQKKKKQKQEAEQERKAAGAQAQKEAAAKRKKLKKHRKKLSKIKKQTIMAHLVKVKVIYILQIRVQLSAIAIQRSTTFPDKQATTCIQPMQSILIVSKMLLMLVIERRKDNDK